MAVTLGPFFRRGGDVRVRVFSREAADRRTGGPEEPRSRRLRTRSCCLPACLPACIARRDRGRVSNRKLPGKTCRLTFCMETIQKTLKHRNYTFHANFVLMFIYYILNTLPKTTFIILHFLTFKLY